VSSATTGLGVVIHCVSKEPVTITSDDIVCETLASLLNKL
jgi:hypothetical protein